MKKSVCLLVVILVSWIGFAYADDCEHVYRIQNEYERYDYGWYSIGVSGHVWRDYYWQKCDLCGDIALVYLEDPYAEKHSYVTTDDWHFDGESVHHYEITCIKCGYVTTYAAECSGEMCIKISVMQNVIETNDQE